MCKHLRKRSNGTKYVSEIWIIHININIFMGCSVRLSVIMSVLVRVCAALYLLRTQTVHVCTQHKHSQQYSDINPVQVIFPVRTREYWE